MIDFRPENTTDMERTFSSYNTDDVNCCSKMSDKKLAVQDIDHHLKHGRSVSTVFDVLQFIQQLHKQITLTFSFARVAIAASHPSMSRTTRWNG
jgi:hypothetical protein